MTKLGVLLIVTVAIATGTSLTVSAAVAQEGPSAAAERVVTVAAVRAVEDHWTRAEVDGDTVYLSQLLLPEYRSVNPDGLVHPKRAIIAGAEKHAAHRSEMAATVDSFRKAHPSRTDVTLHGNTAVVTFVSLVPACRDAIRGADVFVFTEGAWHALYSAHSTAQVGMVQDAVRNISPREARANEPTDHERYALFCSFMATSSREEPIPRPLSCL